jgi:hypothetical protein
VIVALLGPSLIVQVFVMLLYPRLATWSLVPTLVGSVPDEDIVAARVMVIFPDNTSATHIKASS